MEMTKCDGKVREWSFAVIFFSCQFGFFGVGMWLIFTSFAMNGRITFLTVSAKDNSILCNKIQYVI